MNDLRSKPCIPIGREELPVRFLVRVSPALWRGLVLMATLILIGLLLKWATLHSLFGTDWIDNQVRGRGLIGGALFVLIGSIFTAIGLPRQMLGFLGGYAFGLILGTGLALMASIIGAIITFQYARFIGRSFLIRHFPQPIQKIDNFLGSRAILMTLVLRLSPFTNNLATNLAGGISGVKPLPFFLSSLLGYLPQTLIFSLLGSGFNLDPEIRVGISIMLFVISSLLGAGLWYYYRQDFPSVLSNTDNQYAVHGK
ncbi:TVP38/TMEM64 family membrane protein [Gammaproteobacteria bacterium]